MKFPYRNKLTNNKIYYLNKDHSKNDKAIKPNWFRYGIKNKW